MKKHIHAYRFFLWSTFFIIAILSMAAPALCAEVSEAEMPLTMSILSGVFQFFGLLSVILGVIVTARTIMDRGSPNEVARGLFLLAFGVIASITNFKLLNAPSISELFGDTWTLMKFAGIVSVALGVLDIATIVTSGTEGEHVSIEQLKNAFKFIGFGLIGVFAQETIGFIVTLGEDLLALIF